MPPLLPSLLPSLLLLCWLTKTAAESATSLTHTTLVIIVLIELFFAFGVAVTCVLFSWNLMRSIRNNQDFHSMPQGDFPRAGAGPGARSTASSFEGFARSSQSQSLSEPLTGTYNTFYRGRKNNPFSNSNNDLSAMEESQQQSQQQSRGGARWDEDSDEEQLYDHDHDHEDAPASSLFSAFFNYIRM
jgi:hypothetical protein